MGLVAQGQVLSPSGGNGSKYWGRVSGKSVRAPAMPWSRCQTQQGPRGVASGLPPSRLALGEEGGCRLQTSKTGLAAVGKAVGGRRLRNHCSRISS